MNSAYIGKLMELAEKDNDVMRIVKEMNPRIVDQTFDNTCSIKLSIQEILDYEKQSQKAHKQEEEDKRQLSLF